MNYTKIIVGWSLIFLSVAIIFYALFSSFNIFMAKTAVPEIFKTENQKTGSSGGLGLGGIDVSKIVGEQLKSLVPSDTLPKILNLAAWSIFAWILIMSGGQIAGIGIKLLKAN